MTHFPLQTLIFSLLITGLMNGLLLAGPDSDRTPARQTTPGSLRKLTSNDLPRLVRDSGFTLGNSISNEVTFEAQKGNWTFPMRVTLAEKIDTIWVVANLARVTPATDLQALLQTNFEQAPYFFSVDKTTGMIHLAVPLKNHNLNSQEFARAVNDILTLADQTSSLWVQNTSSTSPVGFWHAVTPTGNEVSLTLDANGNFEIIGKDGARFTGEFTIEGNHLRFQEQSGEKFEAELTWKTSNSFELHFSGATPEETAVLSFEKSTTGST